MTSYSGLGAQLTVGTESTWGTAVARNRHFEHIDNKMKARRDYLRSRQLRAGAQFQAASRRVQTTKGAAGSVSMEVPNKQFGVFLNQLHGATVTPTQQGGTAAYLQAHPVGLTDPSGKSLTIQEGVPQTNGTVAAFTYPGSKVTAATFKCAVDAFLTCDLEFDAKDLLTNVALDTFSPASTLRSFHFVQGVLTVDGASAGVVQRFELAITIPYATDRYTLGSDQKALPVINDYPTITPKIDCEFSSPTLHDNFLSGAQSALVLTFEGPTIASTYKEMIRFTIPAAGYNGDTPTVDGPDLLVQDIELETLDNGTDAPLTISYQSVDTAI